MNDNKLNSILEYLAQFHPMAGTIEMYAGQEAPAGWLICDGSAISRTTYSKLFEVIGQTYGAGDGNTTFNLPDMRGRVPVGMNNTSLPNGKYTTFSDRNIGITGGAEVHTLTQAQLPSITGSFGIRRWGTGGLVLTTSGKMSYSTYSATNNPCGTYGTNQSIGDKVTMSFGSGGSHNNMQPFTVINYIISTGQVEYPEIEQEENNG